ncbi:hypothetical protein J4221_01270 [Candidatus Pacearchaeota archaeon]|nr:hypothetical protein [Candidatus Pacearchaeota archaeon]
MDIYSLKRKRYGGDGHPYSRNTALYYGSAVSLVGCGLDDLLNGRTSSVPQLAVDKSIRLFELARGYFGYRDSGFKTYHKSMPDIMHANRFVCNAYGMIPGVDMSTLESREQKVREGLFLTQTLNHLFNTNVVPSRFKPFYEELKQVYDNLFHIYQQEHNDYIRSRDPFDD